AKRVLQPWVWLRKAISTSRCQQNFGTMGSHYRQIGREADGAIYEQVWIGCRQLTVCYEVLRVKRREAFQVEGRLIEPAEVYPNPEDWGVRGFAFTDIDAALAKLRELRVMICDNSADELAAQLRISPRAVREAIQRDLLTFVKHHNFRCWRFG